MWERAQEGWSSVHRGGASCWQLQSRLRNQPLSACESRLLASRHAAHTGPYQRGSEIYHLQGRPTSLSSCEGAASELAGKHLGVRSVHSPALLLFLGSAAGLRAALAHTLQSSCFTPFSLSS